MPFYSLLFKQISSIVGKDGNDAVIITTTFSAYALSTLLIGTVFLLLGKYRLGSLIAYFPRNVLVGSIGCIGFAMNENASHRSDIRVIGYSCSKLHYRLQCEWAKMNFSGVCRACTCFSQGHGSYIGCYRCCLQ